VAEGFEPSARPRSERRSSRDLRNGARGVTSSRPSRTSATVDLLESARTNLTGFSDGILTRMARQPETRYAHGPEGNIADHVVGDGPIDLVVVPGWFSHVDLLWGDPGWVSFIEDLASFARVVLYHKLGTGLSDPVDGVPTLASGRLRGGNTG